MKNGQIVKVLKTFPQRKKVVVRVKTRHIMSVARLRMFAGPNGSGKTAVKIKLDKPANWFGVYLNPDELESTIREGQVLPVDEFWFNHHYREDLSTFLHPQNFYRVKICTTMPMRLSVVIVSSIFSQLAFNSYHASVLADFLRRKCLEEGKSFHF